MNPTIEAQIEAIGQAALANIGDVESRLLIYAEVEVGVISADMFYARGSGDAVQYMVCARPLRQRIYALWEQWRAHQGNDEWRAMCYFIDNGKFTIDFTYPDKIDSDVDLGDRRSAAVRLYFGDAVVNYTAP